MILKPDKYNIKTLIYSKLNILKIPIEDTEEDNSSSSIPGSGNVVKMESPSDLSLLRNK